MPGREVNINEKQLFLQIAEGDENAFLQLFHAYTPEISPVIEQLIKDESAVPDLVQDIFLRIWVSRDKLPGVTSHRSWIFAIVYRQCFNYLRRQAAKYKREKPLTDTQYNESQDASPETILLFEETKKIVREAIDQLPPQAHKVYMLRRDQGLKIEEIAEQMNISPKTVKNTLTRASQSIRDYLLARDIYLPMILITWIWRAIGTFYLILCLLNG